MKIDIIIAYEKRYLFGHEKDFVPSITGVHLAAITPQEHEVRVFHQQVDKIDFKTRAELICISFFSGFANAAYTLAKEFKRLNKTVIAGGPHVTYNKEESLEYFDSIILGESESIWEQVLLDFQNNNLQRIYKGVPTELKNIPTPRFDLLSDKFFLKKVIQATRGCPFSCSFCTVPSLNPGFRKRPVADVVKDASYDHFKYWWQRKIIWFWDDNLTIDRKYIFELLTELKKLNKWWLTQASLDIANDDSLLKLMKESGCIGVFVGIESFVEDSIGDANKKQNKIKGYKKAIEKIRGKGIAVMAGFIAGFDSDTKESIFQMSDKIREVNIDVPFLSIMTPFKGTAVYDDLVNSNRMIGERGWQFYNGYNVAFKPARMSADELLSAHRNLWKDVFSVGKTFRRVVKGAFKLSFGAFCLSLFMNAFYSTKRIRGNYPITHK